MRIPLRSAPKSANRAAARCVLYYKTILPKGPAARPCWIPPPLARSGHEARSRANRSYRRSTTRKETSLSLHPSIRRLSRPLNPLAPSGRCITNRGSVPAPTDTPMTTSLRPFHGDQPCADWMPPSCRRWITPRGLSPPPNPARQTRRSASPPTPNHAQTDARLITATP